jgi:hypothetical protein
MTGKDYFRWDDADDTYVIQIINNNWNLVVLLRLQMLRLQMYKSHHNFVANTKW